ncbi:MAG: terpene cyclase/mutase family protein [Planctomycetaceae bacterium]|nr:terpene cyclase/mutase family protein [Planctomycetaceae bacterium]
MTPRLLIATVLLTIPLTAFAAGPDAADLQASRTRGINFLRTTQSEDGSWTASDSVGISGLVTTALLKSGVSADDPTVVKALEHLETFIQEDGGIYHQASQHRNYETSIALLAFQAANTDGRYNPLVVKAVAFLKGMQWDESEGIDQSDTAYGGAGYGSHERPDMSNTQFMLDAFAAAGLTKDDPAVQKALIFVSRAQNLETEHNTTPHAGKIEDGGFYYTPAAGGETKAGLTPNGGLRSYASMTYAGLKSMIYAGLTEDDQRVKAATEWIKRFYTLDENPGVGQQGLFYYYHTFAKTLSVLDVDEFVEADGTRHDWRKELAEHLASVQQENGSWLNPTDRWYEGDPNLVTAYSLLALSYCDPTSESE